VTTLADRPVVLESGDRLTQTEFHRRYCARPDIKKAELVRGVVYVASPTRANVHARQHGEIVVWLGTYAAHRRGVVLFDNATVILPDETEVQPDACLFRPEAPDRRARINEDGYVEGAPDLVVEVAASSVSYDLHDKKDAYERAGVPEYVVWRVLDHAVDWFRLREGAHAPLQPDADGIVSSEVFPGLRLHIPKLLAGDLAGALAALQR
jgi:Uma2 family endonuclease